MSSYTLGVSAYYHDSAAALLRDGALVAAAQEERFSRRKHDSAFPRAAAHYCLREAGIEVRDLQRVVFYDKPLVKFERLLETYLTYAPRGFRSFAAAMPVWLKDKLYLKTTLKRELAKLGACQPRALPQLLFAEHHQSHAASAFFFSPYERAAILCLDGVGEWATTSVWRGVGNRLEPLWQIDFPHSLGLLYSAFTYYTGFKVNSGEYKLMGLAPYGEPRYVDTILGHLMDLKADGTFRLNMEFFEYCTGLTMTNSRFAKLFGAPPRQPESPISQREMDLAASIQRVTEEVVLRLARTVRAETGEEYLCLAGGVALNCVANGHVLRDKTFKGIWVQPAAGDAGGALGAAAIGWHIHEDQPRNVGDSDGMRGTYLGPCYEPSAIETALRRANAVYRRLGDHELCTTVAELLAAGNVVGWFQGRMEFGPRALGARSILGDARNPSMQSVMNLKIKNRESFRPFAPSVLAERVSDYFEQDVPSPYMSLVAPLKSSQRLPVADEERALFGIDKLKARRSRLPAITHVDYSARIQTVHASTNPRYHKLLAAFELKTGCAVIVNTSFNVRGEPIVCTPEDAYRCFMRTEMDYLVIEDIVLDKREQPPLEEDNAWRTALDLD